MKQIIVFIGLKTAEIAAVVYFPLWAGKLALFLGFPNRHQEPVWLVGLLVIIAVSTLSALVAGLIAANWQWAEKITNRD